MLKLQNINLTLNKNTVLARPILQNLNLHVKTAEFAAIIGSNGCGKSTLFNTIAGVIKPDSGSIMIADANVTAYSSTKRASLVSLVMQEPRVGTMENMTIAENLSVAYMRGKPRSLNLCNSSQRRQFFQDKLRQLNMQLENRLDTLVGTLSGGQRQALSLIMAIIADYKILLLDEITAALDPRSADNVMEIAARIVREEKRTAIMITHNMQHALAYATRIYVMMQGRIKHEYDMQAKNDISVTDLTLQMCNFS